MLKLKRFYIYVLVILFFTLFSNQVNAQFQPTPVVKSQERTIVNGKIYYIHTVQKGQTLYSISKAYEVTQEEIKNSNPQVDVVNLVEGLAIRIPVSEINKLALYPQNKEDFHAHTVKRKDTIYSIAKKYGVDVEIIYHYNPWSRNGISPNQTIWIPKKSEMINISEPENNNDQFYFYTAKEKDTLYSIANLYGITVSDIIDANPELRYGLKQGQLLKIPIKQNAENVIESDSLIADTIGCQPQNELRTYNVALMLPFFSSFTEEQEIPSDSISEEGTYEPQQRQRGLRGRHFAEFYEGFLLAVDSLKKTGLSINLHVYDTERDTLKTKKIIRELSQIQPDIIFGPVFYEDVNITGRFAKNHNINLISPLSTRTSLVEINPKIIQIFPSAESEAYAIANYLKQYNKGRIILVRGTDSISLKNSWKFKKYLLSNIPTDVSGNPLYFKDYRLNDSLFNQLGKILSKEEDNILVVFSNNEAEVGNLITRLIQRASIYPITLFGMPSWQSWTNVDLTFLHTLQLNIISPFYVDYTNNKVKKYLTKSRQQYGYEPFEISPSGYNFSMLGYDVGLYFLNALRLYGKDFASCLKEIEDDQLLTKFNFYKTSSGGYINNSFTIIQYRNDFTVENKASVKGETVIDQKIPFTPSDIVLPLLPKSEPK